MPDVTLSFVHGAIPASRESEGPLSRVLALTAGGWFGSPPLFGQLPAGPCGAVDRGLSRRPVKHISRVKCAAKKQGGNGVRSEVRSKRFSVPRASLLGVATYRPTAVLMITKG